MNDPVCGGNSPEMAIGRWGRGVSKAMVLIVVVVVVVMEVAFSSRARILGECSTNHSCLRFSLSLKAEISLRTLSPP